MGGNVAAHYLTPSEMETTMFGRYTIRGAYGRTYTSKAAVLKDWNDNKDFQIVGGPMINKADAENFGVPEGQLSVRYNKDRSQHIITGLKVEVENTPCNECGSTTTPLHTNGVCGNCYAQEKGKNVG